MSCAPILAQKRFIVLALGDGGHNWNIVQSMNQKVNTEVEKCIAV